MLIEVVEELLEKGKKLFSKNNTYTNAVVLKVEEGSITVLSDFGNIMEMDVSTLKERYSILPTAALEQIEDITCRLEQQIHLLVDALALVKIGDL